MQPVLTFLKYLFDTNPGAQFKFYMPLEILIALLFFSALAFNFIYKKRKETDFAFKRLFKKTGKKLFLLGLLFLLLILLRYETIPYFSMRILLYLSLLLLIYFLHRTVYTFKILYPKEKENANSKLGKAAETKNKYSPNKKKK